MAEEIKRAEKSNNKGYYARWAKILYKVEQVWITQWKKRGIHAYRAPADSFLHPNTVSTLIKCIDVDSNVERYQLTY